MTARKLLEEKLNTAKKLEEARDKSKTTHSAFYEAGYIEGKVDTLKEILELMDILEIE